MVVWTQKQLHLVQQAECSLQTWLSQLCSLYCLHPGQSPHAQPCGNNKGISKKDQKYIVTFNRLILASIFKNREKYVKLFHYHLSILTKPTIPFHLFVVLLRDPHFPLAFLKLTLRLCFIINVRRYSPSRVPSKNVLGGFSTPELDIQKKGSKLLYVTLKSAPLRGHVTE